MVNIYSLKIENMYPISEDLNYFFVIKGTNFAIGRLFYSHNIINIKTGESI